MLARAAWKSNVENDGRRSPGSQLLHRETVGAGGGCEQLRQIAPGRFKRDVGGADVFEVFVRHTNQRLSFRPKRSGVEESRERLGSGHATRLAPRFLDFVSAALHYARNDMQLF